jgi:hypothetical protein
MTRGCVNYQPKDHCPSNVLAPPRFWRDHCIVSLFHCFLEKVSFKSSCLVSHWKPLPLDLGPGRHHGASPSLIQPSFVPALWPSDRIPDFGMSTLCQS